MKAMIVTTPYVLRSKKYFIEVTILVVALTVTFGKITFSNVYIYYGRRRKLVYVAFHLNEP